MRNKLLFPGIIMLSISISACSNLSTKDQAPPEFRSEKLLHTSSTLTTTGEETPGFAYYTYVLAKESSMIEGWSNREELTRLNTLIKEIVDIQQDLNISQKNRASFNIFYLPGKKPYRRGMNDLLSNFNLALSKFYIEGIANSATGDLRQTLFNGKGPFLITAYKPLVKEDENSSPTSDARVLLYYDLSTTHPNTIAQVLSYYKSYLNDKDDDKQEKFFSLRTFILQHIVKADKYVQVIEASVASFIPSTSFADTSN